MCTSFIHRKNGIFIGMNFDNNGMAYDLRADGERFIVRVDGGRGLRPSFGVTATGVFANNLLVDPPPDGLGAYRRASATCTYTQKLGELLLTGALAGGDIPATLAAMEVTNGPGQSCHNMLADAAGNLWVVEPGRGTVYSPAAESPFYVMTNCPLCGLAPGAAPQGTGADRWEKATLLLDAKSALTVADAFDVLRQTAQSEGVWQTAFSMVYSAGEGAVYYCEDRQFDAIKKHSFGP